MLLAPLATTVQPVPNGEFFHHVALTGCCEAIEHGWHRRGCFAGVPGAPVGKRVVAECVVRLAHSAGLLKRGEGCVILPTAGEVEAPGNGGSGPGTGASSERQGRRGLAKLLSMGWGLRRCNVYLAR